MTVDVPPGQPGGVVSFAARYHNWIGGECVPPVKGTHFENVSPVNDHKMMFNHYQQTTNLLVSYSPNAFGFS